MASIFGRSWYVDRGRIQMFLPLNGSISFEIDRTGVGGILGNPTFSTNYGNSLLERNGEAVNSLIFGGSDYFIFNDRLNELLNNAVYGSGRKTSICFWVWTADDTNPDGDGTLANTRGVSNNVVLSDNYFKGYSFGRETMTSVMNMTDDVTKAAVSANIDKHVVTARYKVPSSPESASSELVAGSDNLLNVPSGRWVFVTYTLDHSSADNYVTTMHLRFKDDEGNHKHYYCTGSDMDSYTINGKVETVVGRLGGAWTLGCSRVPVGNSYNFSKFLMGAMRNLMLYSIVLDNNQQQSIYDNGIDPYVADTSPNTEPDADQYDKRFWGKYGVLSTKSVVKIEKSQIRKTTQASALDGLITGGTARPQNARKFSIGARDGAIVSIARNDVSESNTANPTVIDSSADPNEWGNTHDAYGNDLTRIYNPSSGSEESTVQAFSAASWRGASVTGDEKLSRLNSRAIWGGLINGMPDMMRLEVRRRSPGTGTYEDINDPETLPAGKYVARLINNADTINPDNIGVEGYSSDDGAQFYYPSYLPKYYYRDRLGRSWRDRAASEAANGLQTKDGGNNTTTGATYVNEIFWKNGIGRYDRIPWTKAAVDRSSGVIINANSDEAQLDGAEKWDKIYWEFAIYEVEREASLSTVNFCGKIKLTLVSSDFKYSVVYHKFRNPHVDGSAYTLNNVTGEINTLIDARAAFSGWQLDAFNFSQTNGADASTDHLYNETLRRIYLPHVVIPRLIIPVFKDKIETTTLTTGSVTDSNDPSVYNTSSVNITRVDNYRAKWSHSVTITRSGYYRATFSVYLYQNTTMDVSFNGGSSSFSAKNYDTDGGFVGYRVFTIGSFIFVGPDGSITAELGIAIRRTNGGRLSDTVLARCGANGVVVENITPMLSAGNTLVTSVSTTAPGQVDSGSTVWDATRAGKYYRVDPSGHGYVEIEGIGARYTTKNYHEINPDGTSIVNPGNVGKTRGVDSTILDQTTTQYEDDNGADEDEI